MTRRKILVWTFIATGCLFASAARLKEGDCSMWQFGGLGVGLALLVMVAWDVSKTTD